MNIMTVSSNNVGVKGASITQTIFSSQYPFSKLDKTNNVSFQNIALLFAHEPPNPAGTVGNTGPIKTLVYPFAHGYNYVPSTWVMVQNPTNTGVGQQPPYFQESWPIIRTDANNYTAAELHLQVDATNVNFYVWKYYDNTNTPSLPNILGFSLNIRVYVFVGDLTGTTAGS